MMKELVLVLVRVLVLALPYPENAASSTRVTRRKSWPSNVFSIAIGKSKDTCLFSNQEMTSSRFLCILHTEHIP